MCGRSTVNNGEHTKLSIVNILYSVTSMGIVEGKTNEYERMLYAMF